MKSALFFIISIIFSTTPLFSLDLSLEDAKEYTQQNSESIRLKLFEVEEKRLALKETEANRLPDLKVQGSATYMTNPPEGVTIPKGMFGYTPGINSEMPIPFPDRDYVLIEDPENTYFKVTTTLTQPVYTWNKINNAVRIAEDDVAVSEINYELTLHEICHEVSKVYFSTLLVSESLVVLEKAKDVLSVILSDREKSYDQGLINLQKVLGARANLAKMETKYIKTRESYKSGIEALCFFTGLEAGEIRFTTNFRDTLPEIDEEEVKNHTLRFSHDAAMLKKRLNQAGTYVNIEKGSTLFKPDFSFILSLDVSGGRIPFIGANWLDSWDHNITFTLGTEVQLYDGGKSGINIKQAEKKRQMAETGLQQLERSLSLEVRRAIQEVKVAYYTLLEKDVKSREVKEQYKNAKVSYENDLLTREEERGAQVLLYTADLEHLLALYQYETALGELEYLSGMEF